MTFTIDLDGIDDLLSGFDGIASREQIVEATTHGMRETMKQYQSRVNRMTRNWKNENKPYFASQYGDVTDVNFRPTLSNLESAPTNFFLINTRIWNLVSTGAKEHTIRPKNTGGESGRKAVMSFTGYSNRDARSRKRTFGARRVRSEGRTTFLGRQRRDGGRSIITRAKNTRVAGQFGRALAQTEGRKAKFPPTYVAATNPGSLESNRSGHIGDGGRRNVKIGGVINHPGFEGRDLSGKLIEGSGGVGDELNDFFGDQVFLRLNQLTGASVAAGSLEGIPLRNPQSRKLVGEGQKISRTIRRYVNSN